MFAVSSLKGLENETVDGRLHVLYIKQKIFQVVLDATEVYHYPTPQKKSLHETTF